MSALSVRAGIALRCYEPGHGARGPVLLYLHGLGESSACFAGLLDHPQLRDREQRAIDLPGYGYSAPAPAPLSLDEYARLVATWIERELGRPLILIGHSMGGVIGQLVCALPGPHQPLLSGFVNIEGNLSFGDCTASAIAAEQGETDFVTVGFARLLASLEQQGETDPAVCGYANSMRRSDPRQFHRNARELVERSRGENLAREMAEACARLDLPVVFFGGRPGGVAERSIALLEEVAVEVVLFEPSGHWPFIDRRDDLARALERFVATIEPTSPSIL